VQENLALVQMSTSQGMLSTQDLMKDLSSFTIKEEVTEVRFKNNRKAFFRNPKGIRLNKDDRVVLESDGGHDLGTISLSGDLAQKQFELKHSASPASKLKQIYRKATKVDLDKWLEAKRRERNVLLESRSMARELELEMSIGDVEFRGDGKKVTITYTADGRVDFRELIRKYAIAFGVRIEMKQIGARQNAAKVGGIGSCGRELCCSTWKSDMSSVKTEAARSQNLNLNASKLAGQCGKLKCCLNYELDIYLEAWEQFPAELISLESDRGILFPVQPDVLKGIVYYTLTGQGDRSRYVIPIEQVKSYISLNKNGEKVKSAGLTSSNSLSRGIESFIN
jgi:cell fate regulator YaaT (PSP1 superfamily)